MSINRTAIVATIVAAILALTAGVAWAGHGLGSTTVGLNGANEVGTIGDRNGSGKIDLTFFSDETPAGDPTVAGPTVAFPGEYYVCYDLTTRNIGDVVALHIHEVERAEGDETTNPRKLAGPVVIDLLNGIEEKDGQACVASPEVEDILESPAEYYVNVHTAEFPGGAIRGQLHR